MKPFSILTTALILISIFSCSKKADNVTPASTPSPADDLVGTYIGNIKAQGWSTTVFTFDNVHYSNMGNTYEYIVVTKVDATTIHISPKTSSDNMDEFNVNVGTPNSELYRLTIPHQTGTNSVAKYIDQGTEIYSNLGLSNKSNFSIYDNNDKTIWFVEQVTSNSNTYMIKKYYGIKQ